MLLSCSFLDLRRGASHLWDRGLPRHRARTVEARINQLSNLDRDRDALPNPASVINEGEMPARLMPGWPPRRPTLPPRRAPGRSHIVIRRDVEKHGGAACCSAVLGFKQTQAGGPIYRRGVPLPATALSHSAVAALFCAYGPGVYGCPL
jgi:hypothetical protein